MAKIFDIQDWLKNNPNRNNFDLTHKVHGSYKFGYWYPFLCKPVVPTDSFHIETAVSTRFMPMPFPTQSNMRLIFHYHYVRAKNIWSNFENWLMGLEEHTPPYLNLPHTFYKNGSLADYLGVQTSFHSAERSVLRAFKPMVTDRHDFTSQSLVAGEVPFSVIRYDEQTKLYYVSPSYQYRTAVANRATTPNALPDVFFTAHIPSSQLGNMEFLPTEFHISDLYINTTNYSAPANLYRVYIGVRSSDGATKLLAYDMVIEGAETFFRVVEFDADDKHRNVSFATSPELFICFPISSSNNWPSSAVSTVPSPFYSESSLEFTQWYPERSIEIGSNDVADCPYQCSDTPSGDTNVERISSLPFRAYESVCRAYYRNTQGVQPFVVNGVTKYNQWNTTTDDGADSTEYTLFKRNWELDAYTSCLLTPQQLPVFVGLTSVSSLGRMSVETPDGQEAEVRLADGDNPQSVEYSNLQAETPEARRYALNVASLGFTIPEFREANSLQRWLEMNIRKGYRYKDFIEGHFGKAPKYSELDMPEFLGGFTQKVSVNDISNTNGGTDPSDISGTLGAIAGQARAIGGSKHGVNHYFDDFGFVIGVFCIVPDVAYDCLVPKHFNLKSPLDLYFPEFSQTSFQEITFEELTPAQRKVAGLPLASSFGYQRPNHELVWYPDTVHGRFRDATGIGNSVVCRRFSSSPELSSSFLEIDPQSTDTIFSYTLGDDDICLGEIVIGISAKRPVPRLFNPSIS